MSVLTGDDVFAPANTGRIREFITGRSTVKRNLTEGIVLGTFLTTLSYLVGIYAGWIENINYLEAFAVFTSYVCTYLCVRERRINYPIGAVSTAAYAVLFYQAELMASAALSLYLTPALIYGWFRWNKDEVTRPVTRVAGKMIPVYLGVTAAFFAGGLVLLNSLGTTLPTLDMSILAGSMLAQFLLDNKKIETWMVWAAVNVAAIYTYASAGLALVAFQYVFFLANTVFGMYTWKHSSSREKVS